MDAQHACRVYFQVNHKDRVASTELADFVGKVLKTDMSPKRLAGLVPYTRHKSNGRMTYSRVEVMGL